MNDPHDKPDMAKTKEEMQDKDPRESPRKEKQAAAQQEKQAGPQSQPPPRDTARTEGAVKAAGVAAAEAAVAGVVAAETPGEAGAETPAEKSGNRGGQPDIGGSLAAGAEQVPEEEPGGQDAEIEALRNEVKANFEKFLLTQADFENYKKRVTKEHADNLKFALTPLLREMAGMIDNLERAVEHTRNGQGDAAEALVDGIEMVIKQVHETLERFHVTRIEAAGKPFDPELHEAMTVVETEDVPENQVIDVFEAGYQMHGRIVRPARVSVSKRPAES